MATKKVMEYDSGNSPWLWNGEPLLQAPEGQIAFVYLITNKNNGKRYVGYKTIMSETTKSINHKKKKVLVESDWRNYWSSSAQLFEAVEDEGKDNFLREIILFSPNKSVAKYFEAEEQFARKVLSNNSDLYYNGIINLRLNLNTVKKWNQVIRCEKLLGDELAERIINNG